MQMNLDLRLDEHIERATKIERAARNLLDNFAKVFPGRQWSDPYIRKLAEALGEYDANL